MITEDKHSTTFVYSIANDRWSWRIWFFFYSLSQPTIGRRGQLVFGITFSQYKLKDWISTYVSNLL